MPLDHFCISVPAAQFEDTIKFITTSLGHMGVKENVRPIPTVVGLGESSTYFWLSSVEGDDAEYKRVLKGMHVAFTAGSMYTVHAVYPMSGKYY
jgi:hypothetical protein